MTLKCPRCEESSTNGRACRRCGLVLTLSSALGFYWHSFLHRFCSIRSPVCKHIIPLNARSCPVCGAPVKVAAAFRATANVPRRRWQRFLDKATPNTKRRVQLVYFLLSIVALFIMMNHASKWERDDFNQRMIMTVFHLAMVLLLVCYFVPRRFFYQLAARTSPVIKLALLLNYFTVLLLFQTFIKFWWEQAGVLILLYLVTYGAAFIFSRFVLPMAENVRGIFSAGSEPFDPAAPQGKHANYD